MLNPNNPLNDAESEINSLNNYWSRYGYGAVEFITAKPKPASFKLTELDVEEIEYAFSLRELYNKRKKVAMTTFLLICFTLTFLLMVTGFYSDDSYVQDTANRIFYIVVSGFGGIVSIGIALLSGAALVALIKWTSELLGYDIAAWKPGRESSKITLENLGRYNDYKLAVAKYRYWQIMQEVSTWHDPSVRYRLSSLITEVLRLDGYEDYIGDLKSFDDSTDSFIRGKKKGKILINLKLDDRLIDEYYIKNIKLDAEEHGCHKMIIFTLSSKVAKSGIASIGAMKERGIKVETPDDFLLKIRLAESLRR
jgi:hypothetical protein